MRQSEVNPYETPPDTDSNADEQKATMSVPLAGLLLVGVCSWAVLTHSPIVIMIPIGVVGVSALKWRCGLRSFCRRCQYSFVAAFIFAIACDQAAHFYDPKISFNDSLRPLLVKAIMLCGVGGGVFGVLLAIRKELFVKQK